MIDEGNSFDLLDKKNLDRLREFSSSNLSFYFKEDEIRREKYSKGNNEVNSVIPISLQKKTMFSIMLVVDNESAYNVILGRPWIHENDAVVLSLQYMIKYAKGKIIEG